jgi:hypothetical protein
MINDPDPEQGSAGQSPSSVPPPIDQPSYDRREAREAVQRVFEIKDPEMAYIIDSRGQTHSFMLGDGLSWKKLMLGNPPEARCCLLRTGSLGTAGTIIKNEPMPGPHGECERM